MRQAGPSEPLESGSDVGDRLDAVERELVAMRTALGGIANEAVAARRASLDVVAAFERFAGSVSAVHEAAVAARDLGATAIDDLANEREAINRLTALTESWAATSLDAVHRTADAQLDSLRRIASTVAALAEHVATTTAPQVPEDAPLVSVIVAVRNRRRELRRALASVVAQSYRRWECVVVDDGSSERLDDVVAGFDDPRIRLVRTEPAGSGAARNVGAGIASGDVLTFLDSDNELFEHRLGTVAAYMAARPWVGWAVDALVVDDTAGRMPFVGNLRAPLHDLDRTNFVDTGSICVRPALFSQVGGFDVGLETLQDWDLARRLATIEPPARLPTVGFRYRDDGDDRMTVTVPHGPSAHQIRRAAVGRPGAGLRVLLAEWHYPQLTETYIEADVRALVDLGADVEVWSDEDVATSYPAVVRVHRGPLADVIERFGPDVVLSHWLYAGRDYRSISKAAGVPHVVRTHGFDFDPALADALARDPGVLLHVFPHQAGRWVDHPQVTAHPVGFDPARYRPVRDKDRSLVVRVASGLATKDLDVFLEVANRCPEHRFVLVLGSAYRAEARADEVVARSRELRSPAEIRIDIGHDEVADLVAAAGLYLHTHGTDHPLGMPVSIAEAMATGAHVLARDLPGMAAYLGDAGERYGGETVEARAEHAATLIHATSRWTDRRWQQAWTAAVDEAWHRFPADLVMAAMVLEWRERLAVGRR